MIGRQQRKSQPPYRLVLRVLAAKIERGLLSPKERLAAAKFIRNLAEGHSVDEALGIRPLAHRPPQNSDTKYAFEVARAMASKSRGGDDLLRVQAIELVAQTCKKSRETIESALKSKVGGAVYRRARADFRDPLEDEPQA